MRSVRQVIYLAAALSLVAASCSGDDPAVETYSGYMVDPPNEVAGIVMPVAETSGTDTSEAPAIDPFDFSAASGGLNLIYFGYTFCPDVCPTTMADVRRVLAALPEDEADRIGVAMVTVDPGRDTAQVLSEYVANFVDEGVALRTDDATQLRAAADAFGADYEVLTNAEGDIEVSHTGELYAVDDSGTVVMQWPFGTSHESVTRDIRSLLAQADPPT
jgi:protein SCO1/2